MSEVNNNLDNTIKNQHTTHKTEDESSNKPSKHNTNYNNGGKWYILHVAASSEKKAKEILEEQIKKHDMKQYFNEIIIPFIKSTKIVKNKNTTVEKNLMPGYMLINMVMNDDSWHLVQSTQKIYGFLGNNKSMPIPQKDVDKLLLQMKSESEKAQNANIYNVNDMVTITNGPFNSFTGKIEHVNNEKQIVKVQVEIFDKTTPIYLEFNEVKKILSQ